MCLFFFSTRARAVFGNLSLDWSSPSTNRTIFYVIDNLAVGQSIGRQQKKCSSILEFLRKKNTPNAVKCYKNSLKHILKVTLCTHLNLQMRKCECTTLKWQLQLQLHIHPYVRYKTVHKNDIVVRMRTNESDSVTDNKVLLAEGQREKIVWVNGQRSQSAMCMIHWSIWFHVNGIYGSVDESERMSQCTYAQCARSHNRLHKNKIKKL